MKKPHKLLFVVRQYVWAKNAQDAIKISRKSDTHEVWIDDEFKKNQQYPRDAIGFIVNNQEES